MNSQRACEAIIGEYALPLALYAAIKDYAQESGLNGFEFDDNACSLSFQISGDESMQYFRGLHPRLDGFFWRISTLNHPDCSGWTDFLMQDLVDGEWEPDYETKYKLPKG